MSFKVNYRKRVHNNRNQQEILDEKDRKHNEYLTRRKRNRRESTVDNADQSNISVEWDFENYCAEYNIIIY